MILNIILWTIFGAIAGWIASIIMRTNAEQGAVANVVVGIVGAIIGGWIAKTLTGNDVTGFNLPSLIIAIIGAVVLLAILKAFGFMGGRGVHHQV
jgi:uncharacterized membrane protein YeaQ/YmgE (transglycosylase-associated protein family)